jgi:hypothetical protein
MEGKIRNEENGESRPLTFDDITLHVCIPWNTHVERDVNCDSQFMIDCTDKIGTSIQNAYHFVPETEKSTFSWTMLEDMEVMKQKIDMRTD